MLWHIRKIKSATSKPTTSSQPGGGEKISSSPDTYPRDPRKACGKCTKIPTHPINTIPSDLSFHTNVNDFKALQSFCADY